MHPLSKSASVVLDAKQDRTSTVDQHTTQIRVAPLAHAEQLLLPASGILPRHDAKPSCEVPSRRKAVPLPMPATVAVETSGPKPGIWRRRRQCAFSLPLRSIAPLIALISTSICFHSCHIRSRSQRKRELRFCSASSITEGRFLRR